MKSQSLALILLVAATSHITTPRIGLACDQCASHSCASPGGCTSCGSGCSDSGLLDRSANVFGAIHSKAKSMLGLRKKRLMNCRLISSGGSKCDGGPNCGCEMAAEPSCGCASNAQLAEPSCGMEPSCGVPTYEDCGCDSPIKKFFSLKPASACGGGIGSRCIETAPSCPKEPLLSRLFKHKCASGCDVGSTPSYSAAPSCGCEASAPDCGCETSFSDSSRGGLLDRVFARRGSVGSGPSCGCESAPSCGCESFSEASCGVESNCNCNDCQGGYSSNMSMYDPAPVADQYEATPEVQQYAPFTQPSTPQYIAPAQPQPMMQQDMQDYGYDESQNYPMEEPLINPAPAPAPPSIMTPQTQPRTTPAPVPESEIDPFLDDAVNQIRRLPAKTIQYQRPQRRPSYRSSYDPQASNSVRVRFSDGNVLQSETSTRQQQTAEFNRSSSQVVTASSNQPMRVAPKQSNLRAVPRDYARSNQSFSNPLR